MWGRGVGGAPGGLRLLLLLLLLPGSMGLECLSCGSDAGSCDGAEIVSCPPESDVCVEALGAVAWSHGRFWLGGRGCGRGQPGGHARALQLAGLVLFSRRRHCRGGRGCNAELPLGQQGALPAAGDASPAPPNGLRCFGCPDDGPCAAPHVVRCPGELRACFRGNVSLALGGRRLWREVRGCAREANCSGQARGDESAALSGVCCAGDLCNGPGPARPGLFAPELPRLQLLPHGHGNAATPPDGNATDKMAAGASGANGSANGANGDVNGVNGSANGVNGGVNGVNGSANGVNGGVNGGKAKSNMAAGINGDVAGVNGDVNGVNGDVNGVNGSANGANGDVNGDVSGGKAKSNMAAGANGDVAGVNGDVSGVNGDVNGVNGSANGDVNDGKAKSNMAAGANGVNGSVSGVNSDVTRVTGDVTGDVTTKMGAGRAGRPLEGQTGAKGPVGRGHAVGGASWLLPLLLLPLL